MAIEVSVRNLHQGANLVGNFHACWTTCLQGVGPQIMRRVQEFSIAAPAPRVTSTLFRGKLRRRQAPAIWAIKPERPHD
jgi:hypothetical protein